MRAAVVWADRVHDKNNVKQVGEPVAFLCSSATI
jgi:hypothetical protein